MRVFSNDKHERLTSKDKIKVGFGTSLTTSRSSKAIVTGVKVLTTKRELNNNKN